MRCHSSNHSNNLEKKELFTDSNDFEVLCLVGISLIKDKVETGLEGVAREWRVGVKWYIIGARIVIL